MFDDKYGQQCIRYTKKSLKYFALFLNDDTGKKLGEIINEKEEDLQVFLLFMIIFHIFKSYHGSNIKTVEIKLYFMS